MVEPLYPPEMASLSVEEFLAALPSLDAPFAAKCADAAAAAEEDAPKARERLAPAERFQRERAKKARAMDERRRLYKEHPAALRACPLSTTDAAHRRATVQYHFRPPTTKNHTAYPSPYPPPT